MKENPFFKVVTVLNFIIKSSNYKKWDRADTPCFAMSMWKYYNYYKVKLTLLQSRPALNCYKALNKTNRSGPKFILVSFFFIKLFMESEFIDVFKPKLLVVLFFSVILKSFSALRNILQSANTMTAKIVIRHITNNLQTIFFMTR